MFYQAHSDLTEATGVNDYSSPSRQSSKDFGSMIKLSKPIKQAVKKAIADDLPNSVYPLDGHKLYRRTLKNIVEVSGTGLHSGMAASVRLIPQASGYGIQFRRTDLAGEISYFKADYALVGNTMLCTELVNHQTQRLATIEHLMAALSALSISDLLIEIDGPELPILDGSAEPWLVALREAGWQDDVTRPQVAYLIRKEVRVDATNGAYALLRPFTAEEEILSHQGLLHIDLQLCYHGTAIGQPRAQFWLNDANFGKLAEARTFCLKRDIDMMNELGKIKGGSLDNAIVVDGMTIVNEGGLRQPQEFVNHKILDCVGDMALAGAPLVGSFEGHCSGHGLNNQLLRKLFTDSSHFDRVALG